MNRLSISGDAEFLRSLTLAQREYFLVREHHHHEVLLDTMRNLARGMDSLDELHNETVLVALHVAAARQE